MKHTIVGALGLAVIALPLSATAVCVQTGPINGTLGCDTQTPRHLDQQVKATYNTLEKALAKQDRKKLARAQQAWKRFRERNCDLQSALPHSAESDTTKDRCRLRMTRRRLAELQRELGTAQGRNGVNLALSYGVFVTPRAGGLVKLPAPSAPLVLAGRPLSFYTTLSGLAPAQLYRYECRIRDAHGHLVVREHKRLSSGSGWSREVCSANPGAGAYAPGRWSFEVFIDGRRYIHTHRVIHFH